MAAVANVAINVDSRGAVSKLRELQTRTSALDKATQGLTRSLAGLAAGFGATFALSKIISDVAKLDTNLRRLGTVGGDVQGLSKTLDQVGKNVEGLAGKAELAAASYQALSAGFTDTAQNARVVEAATKAAVGGLVDVTSVVEVTTKTLNAYGMSGNEAVKVTDSISKAIEFGQVQWSDYTSQLGRVASVAAVAGVSLDEVNAFIAAATKNGATAEIAFTGLGATLSTLLQPTKDSQKAAAELGIAWNLSGLQAKGFDKLIEELGQKMGGNQEAAVKLLGSQEALRGAFAAASKGGSDYRAILEGLGGAAGKTESDFEKMKGSLENQIKALNTAFTALGTKLFEVFGPTLTDLITGTTTALTNAVDAFNALPEPVKKGTAELVKMIVQVLLVKKAIEGIIALRTAFVAAMVAKAGAIASTGTAAKTSASAFALYTANTKTLQAQAATATPVLRGLLGVLSQLALIGTITIAVNIITTGVQQLMDAKKELEELQGRRAAGGAAAQFAGETRAGGELRQKTARSTIKAIEKERPELQRQIELLKAIPGGAGRLFTRNLENRLEVLKQREDEARRNLALPLPPKPKPPELPTRPFRVGDVIDESTVAGGKVGGGGGAATQLKEQKDLSDAIYALELKRQDVRFSNNELLKIQVDKELATQKILESEMKPRERLVALQDAENNAIEKAAQLMAPMIEGVEELQNGATEAGKAFAQLYIDADNAKLAEKAKELDNLYRSIGDTITTSIVNSLTAAVEGTKSLAEVASSTLRSIANILLKFGLNTLTSGLAGNDGVGFFSKLFGGGRASGGTVRGGTSYLVGERGPELFTPNRSGSIAPNGSMGGSTVVVNVDASGTQVQGNNQNAKQLGQAIGAAVQAELIKQKRPGGLLAS